MSEFHYVGCTLNSEVRSPRHAEAVALLRAALAKAWGQGIQWLNVQLEKTDDSGRRSPVSVSRRRNGVTESSNMYADLAFSVNNREYYIDVSFIDPAGANAIRRGSLAAGGKAADLREASKRKEYEAAMGKVWADSSFVPFVLETTGRLGRAAAKLIHHLVVDGPSHRQYSATDPSKPSARLYKALVRIHLRGQHSESAAGSAAVDTADRPGPLDYSRTSGPSGLRRRCRGRDR